MDLDEKKNLRHIKGNDNYECVQFVRQRVTEMIYGTQLRGHK